MQIVLYALEHKCFQAEAAVAVGALRKACCDSNGVVRHTQTPKSFCYCQYDVIKYAWTQLTRVGLTSLFATKQWYSFDEVNELVVIADESCADLGPDKLATASCNGLWHFLGTDNGPAVAKKWCADLGPDKFAKASCNGLWHFLGTEKGLVHSIHRLPADSPLHQHPVPPSIY